MRLSYLVYIIPTLVYYKNNMEFIDLALKDCHITVCLVGELLSLLFQHDLAISHYILLTAVMVLGIKMCFPFLYLYYSGHIIYHVH